MTGRALPFFNSGVRNMFHIVLTLMWLGIAVCSGVSAMDKLENSRDSSAFRDVAGWDKCTQTIDRKIQCPVTVTQISMIGGLYVKGHLNSYRDRRVHLVWEPQEHKSDEVRSKLREGSTVIVRGECQGKTEQGEIIIMVREVVGCVPRTK